MRKLFIAMSVILTVLFVLTLALLITACTTEPEAYNAGETAVAAGSGMSGEDMAAQETSPQSNGNAPEAVRKSIHLLDALIIVLTVVTVAAFTLLIISKERRT